jgi:sugar phosphate isomerase/epimerase
MSVSFPVNLQLYTLRDELAADVEGTLAAVGTIGYAGVELAGLHGRTAAEFKALLDANGLAAVGMHVGFDALRDNPQSVVDDALVFGVGHVVVPWIGAPWSESVSGLSDLGAELARLSAPLTAAGLVLCYHNHAFEFERVDGGLVGFDALFDAAGGAVQAELDTYWVKKAGHDPVATLARYAGRVPLVHLKDMGDDGGFRPVGDGSIDYTALLPAAVAAGAKHFIVEQDQCTTASPLESVERSLRNLESWGVVAKR